MPNLYLASMNFVKLESYLPENSLPFVKNWIENENLTIKLRKPRKSKLGDYRFNNLQKSHEITVDSKLNPYAFFFVLTHEIAHFIVHKVHSGRTLPHGKEWKNTFGKMLMETLEIYPQELQFALINHARNPKASMGADRVLWKNLFQLENEHMMVENLEEFQKFRLGRRVFQKGKKRKIRYLCREIPTGKLYLVNGQAVVDELINT